MRNILVIKYKYIAIAIALIFISIYLNYAHMAQFYTSFQNVDFSISDLILSEFYGFKYSVTFLIVYVFLFQSMIKDKFSFYYILKYRSYRDFWIKQMKFLVTFSIIASLLFIVMSYLTALLFTYQNLNWTDVNSIPNVFYQISFHQTPSFLYLLMRIFLMNVLNLGTILIFFLMCQWLNKYLLFWVIFIFTIGIFVLFPNSNIYMIINYMNIEQSFLIIYTVHLLIFVTLVLSTKSIVSRKEFL